jgi:hypothetical protein
MQTTTNNKQIQVIDICLPDYFSGYSKTVIQIPIYQKSFTCEQIANDIESELNMLWELMEETHSPEELQIWGNYVNELKERKDELFYEDENYVEQDENDMQDCAYIYFGLTNPVNVNGITFLNP